MGSVFKFPLALAVLQRVDRGEMHLNDPITITPAEFSTGFSPIRDAAKGKAVHTTVRDLVVAMLRDSDNTAADFFLARLGGGGKVNEVVRTLGVSGIRVDRSERQMGKDLHAPGGVSKYAVDDRDTSTPNAMATLLTKFHRGEDGLAPASHALALELMTASTTGPKRIRSILPAGATLAHKTGTMPGTANDVGIIVSPDGTHHIVVAIFTKAGNPDRLPERERAIAQIAKELYDGFVSPR
jgi:beta-lactamase class A